MSVHPSPTPVREGLCICGHFSWDHGCGNETGALCSFCGCKAYAAEDTYTSRVRDHAEAVDGIVGIVDGSPESYRPEPDLVNHPPHYTTGKIEVIDFIEDQKFGYLDGQVIKYVSRFKHKGNPKQDLEKARFYLDRLIKSLEEGE